MSKLPAKTPAEVGALPDGLYKLHGPAWARKEGTTWHFIGHISELKTSRIVDGGGITARIGDTAPLEARIVELTELIGTLLFGTVVRVPDGEGWAEAQLKDLIPGRLWSRIDDALNPEQSDETA